MEASALTHSSSMPGLRGPSALLRLQSDERLIALTRRGQPAAFETLCGRYSSRLQAFCRHMLGSREDAEDVLQEVFAAAFNAVLADDREINVRPWLYRIARNRSLNHLRRAAAIGVDTMDTHFAENGISTSDKVLRRESFRELIADVHQLPETQRTALLLREIDALSYDQIAQAMETTIPSVKSLLVRARISLAEAAEARKLSCEEVRLELGEAAEGLAKLSTPARRHVRGCERCAFFKRQLKVNNRALAAVMPVGPLLLAKKLLIAKLGSTASAGSAHVAGGATMGAGATVGAGATIGAGAAAGGGASLAGGLMTAGAGALATKAVAGLAAAAIVTAGAVAADHSVAAHPHRARVASTYASVPATHYSSAPAVIAEHAQPLTAGRLATHRAAVLARARSTARRLAAMKAAPAASAVSTVTTPLVPPVAVPVSAPADPSATPTAPPSAVQVTEVTSEATQLPTGATTDPPAATTPTTTTPAPTTAPPGTTTTPAPAPSPPAATTPPASAPVQPSSAEPVAAPEAAAVAPVEAPAARRSLHRVLATGGTEAPPARRPQEWGWHWTIRR
ncbi:MAG TPA: RNA polymerase sigma factor [Solirubrobacteraceae bacterium]|nr:RNA polymerase sigma factor [Solirubrobacteraceae bacterium]